MTSKINYPYSLNESKVSLSPNDISEAIYYLIEFKNLIKNVKSGSFKAYIVKNDIFKICYEKLEINFDNYDFTNKDKYYFSSKLNNINFFDIKIINSLEDLGDSDFEIINDKVIKKLTKFRNYYNKDITYNKISEIQQEIIFNDSSKIKISIKDKQKKISLFESPFIQ